MTHFKTTTRFFSGHKFTPFPSLSKVYFHSIFIKKFVSEL